VRYVRRALNLAFLAPKIVEAIAAGNYRIWRPGLVGGGGGIRTHERLSPLTLFKTGAFNRSATPPCSYLGASITLAGGYIVRKMSSSRAPASARRPGSRLDIRGRILLLHRMP
jgi:hypothetical protein